MVKTADPLETAVLVCADRQVPRCLTGFPALPADAPETRTAIARYTRLLVVGDDAGLAAVLALLLRIDRLDIEVGHAPNSWAARRVRAGIARRVPLIRDETGRVIVGAGLWLPADGAATVHGEAVVDDTVLFDGDVAGVRIEPTVAPPGLRAAVVSARGRGRRWVPGRAAQLGTSGALVVRDGVPSPRPVRRSTFYRHIDDWRRLR